MEAVAAIIGSALIQPFKFVFGSIYDAMKNRFKIHSNYNQLERDITLVLALKTRLRSGLDDVQLQHLLPTTQVQDWLSKVEELEKNFNSFRSTLTESGITSDSASCCSGSLHCKLSNDIAKQIVKAKQLIEEGKPFEDKIVGIPVARPVQYIEVTSIKGQPTASKNLAKMMDLLKSEEYKRIGVWGMGGVGKTTLVKNLNNQLTNDPTFNIVILVVVSQNATVEGVQSKIAERLELHMMNREVSKESMASRLYNKLKGERFLLILDDIWEEIDLDVVGIPRPNEHTGSKIILTTRDFNVCQQMLTDIDFQMGRLHPEEAWKLFRETVEEEVVDDDQIKPMAEAIVKECDGLPLALIMVGASLRKKREIGLWQCALHALQKSEPSRIRGVEEKVYKPLKWSYDSLQGQQLKSCFLFFCLFPEDFEIHTYKLVQYWVAEGLIDEQQNFEQLQNEVIRIVDYLKGSCLLEIGQRLNHVKMHDVVRDVGVWIAKSLEEGCKAIIKAGISGTQISQQLFNCSGVKRVSFMASNIEFLPNYNIQCAEASTLFLQGNQRLLEVSNTFLQGFQMLRILDLSETKIKFLPHSLLQLGELRALFLEKCCELLELPSLATLGMLQVLNCSASAITKLPEDFEKLTNLRQLDLSHTYKLRKISSEKVSKLCSLEFLNMMGSATKWRMRKVNDENLPFEKLLCLDQLLCFHIDLEDISHVTAEHVSWLRRINSFCVNVTHGDNIYQTYKPHRLHVKYKPNTKRVFFSGFLFSEDESVGWLLVHAFCCEIWECKGVDLMLLHMVRSSVAFVNLKRLVISGCCISVKRSSQGCVTECDLLPNLEELLFLNLTELESISDCSNFLGLRFTKLRFIVAHDCYQLENLFTMDGTLHELANLKTIVIRRCMNLSQVFKNTPTDNFVPMLKSLTLEGLPALEEICKADESWKSLKKFRVRECSKLLKLPLSVQSAENIQSIMGEQNWWNELQWDNENLKMHLHPLFKPSD
ncbi:PREDICTED: disease resistance protein At4g27190-like [Ipomoea nil]|uniref:disease resistance protein At4g27190-like n=1 Tax=Ipomoea nil TaxID=35883 RepID=UPI000900E4A7|nr:PREDICTED: disease resistance protein At4g27190-like [Ipomoea nil]XP_019175921.1 PREDICTED: disease resistance protein At4g27190-like [Ipomoea nil]